MLWVTFDFPPRQSSGFLRPIKLYKYFDKELWDIDFLTQSLAGYEAAVVDHTLLGEVEPLPRVYRVPNLVVHDWVRRLLRRGRKAPETASVVVAAGAPTRGQDRPVGWWRRVMKRLYRSGIMLFYFPDQFFLWGWMTALAALRLHFKNRYDLIYTTSYPESAHIAGFMLRALGVKWVADYRYGGALWVKNILREPKGPLRRRLELWYQGLALGKADLVVTQSDSIREDFTRHFLSSGGAMKTVPSGFDESDFTGGNGNGTRPFARAGRVLHLLHTGNANLDAESRERMLREIGALGRGLKASGYDVVLHALGEDLFGTKIGAARGFDYVYHGVVPHTELPPYLLAADLYVLTTITTSAGSTAVNGYLPSKMWEYLRGGKPILLFGPRDEVWRLIDEAGAGVYMGMLDGTSRVDPESILKSVRSMRPRTGVVQKHSWASRARVMQGVFAEVLHG